MKVFFILMFLPTLLWAAMSSTPITVLSTKYIDHSTLQKEQIVRVIENNFDVSQYREVKVQLIRDQPDHLLVQLLSKTHHTVEMASVDVDSKFQTLAVHKNYVLQKEDDEQQPGAGEPAACPDPSIEFIAFCPNNIAVELEVTKDVAAAARSHGLKTVELLLSKATRATYLNYMSCPNLKGNFYDGDADPTLFITYDGVIKHSDFSSTLKGKFRYKVMNIWLACQAHVNPMLNAVVNDAQAQKYAAGINNLLVGPSDYAAACTFKAVMNGKAITPAFDACYKQYDTPEDIWGLSGHGSEYFGQ